MTPTEPRGGEGVELTSATEVLDLIQSDDAVILAAKRFGLRDGALIEFAYTLIGDRKDRALAPSSPPSGGGGWPSREKLCELTSHLSTISMAFMNDTATAQDVAAARRAIHDALFPPVVGWRPIETAPRDGTEFQAWWGGQWQPGARFDPEYGSFQLWGRTDFDTEGWETFAIEGHWQPLPAAPLTTEGVGETAAVPASVPTSGTEQPVTHGGVGP